MGTACAVSLWDAFDCSLPLPTTFTDESNLYLLLLRLCKPAFEPYCCNNVHTFLILIKATFVHHFRDDTVYNIMQSFSVMRMKLNKEQYFLLTQYKVVFFFQLCKCVDKKNDEASKIFSWCKVVHLLLSNIVVRDTSHSFALHHNSTHGTALYILRVFKYHFA